jgi:hypothetical protein
MTQAAHTITASSELLDNFQAAVILAPDKDFSALQTAAGGSLLFSIGTTGALYVTEESLGEKTGWTRTDLSTARAGADFPAGPVRCSAFAVSQRKDGTLGVAMVLSGPDRDLLYLSRGNSASDTSWIRNPAFKAHPFDAPGAPSPLRIAGVYISQTASGEYILVDVLRDAESPAGLIDRYRLDPDAGGGQSAYRPASLTIDLEKGGYTSCLGRKAGQQVDGIYTAGKVTTFAQIVYRPLFNPFDPSEVPNPSRLELPGQLMADAIAACRNGDDTTDLYVATGGALYRFASNNQADGARAQRLVEHSMFVGVRQLHASMEQGHVVIWGINGHNQVFYIKSPASELDGGGRWSTPLSILKDVTRISPYLNRRTGANTFFAHAGGDHLVKMEKSPETGLWRSQSITLPSPSPQAAARKFRSYTTRLEVADAAGKAARDVEVALSADTTTTLYINRLYYVVGPTPILVKTDALGFITIVEEVTTLHATKLRAKVGAGAELAINATDKTFRRATRLDSVEKLRDAKITNPDGSTRPLVPPGTPEGHLAAAAALNKKLASVYEDCEQGRVSRAIVPPEAAEGSSMRAASSASPAILVDLGDVFVYLAQGGQYLIDLVQDALTQTWEIVVKIGDTIYRAVLDAVDKVVEAVQWVYDKVKTGLQDLFDYLKFLFEWDDITRTKQVIKNLTKLYLRHQVDQIPELQRVIDEKFRQAIEAVRDWGNIDWSVLGEDGRVTLGSRSGQKTGLSAPSTYLLDHLEDNAGQITATGGPSAESNPASGIVDALLRALSNEAKTLGKTITAFRKLADDLPNMSLVDALKAIAAILGSTVIESVQNVIDAVLSALYSVALGALQILDTPIRVPVISDILESFGVPSLSLLDLFAWIAAVPATILYKLKHEAAPFPEGDETRFLIEATSFEQIQRALLPAGGSAFTPRTAEDAFAPRVAEDAVAAFAPRAGGADLPALGEPISRAGSGASDLTIPAGPFSITLSRGTAKALWYTGKWTAGICGLGSAVFDSFEMNMPTDESKAGLPSIICAIVGGAADFLAESVVPHAPIRSTAVVWISRITNGVRFVFKLAYSGVVQKSLTAGGTFEFMRESNYREVGAVFDALLTFPSAFCTIYHFVELGQIPASQTRTLAILEEVSNMLGYGFRIAYAAGVNAKDPETKAGATATVAFYGGVSAILLLVQGGIGPVMDAPA